MRPLKTDQQVLLLAGLTLIALVGGIGVAVNGQAEESSGKTSSAAPSTAPTSVVTSAATPTSAAAPTTPAPATTTTAPRFTDAASLGARLVPPASGYVVSSNPDAAGYATSFEKGLTGQPGILYVATAAYEKGSDSVLVVAVNRSIPCSPSTLATDLATKVKGAHTDGTDVAVGTLTQGGVSAVLATTCAGSVLIEVIGFSQSEQVTAGFARTEAKAVLG